MTVDEQLGLHSVSLRVDLYGTKKQDDRRRCNAQIPWGGISGQMDMQVLISALSTTAECDLRKAMNSQSAANEYA
jgi:hypothetical protein